MSSDLPEPSRRFHPGGVSRDSAYTPTPEGLRRSVRSMAGAFGRIAEGAAAAGAALRRRRSPGVAIPPVRPGVAAGLVYTLGRCPLDGYPLVGSVLPHTRRRVRGVAYGVEHVLPADGGSDAVREMQARIVAAHAHQVIAEAEDARRGQ